MLSVSLCLSVCPSLSHTHTHTHIHGLVQSVQTTRCGVQLHGKRSAAEGLLVAEGRKVKLLERDVKIRDSKIIELEAYV